MLFINRKKRYERTIKAAFRSYFDTRQGFDLCQLEITNIHIGTRRGIVEMTVTLCKPGLLIGVEGKTLTMLEGHIQRRVEKPFRIIIKESKLWR